MSDGSTPIAPRQSGNKRLGQFFSGPKVSRLLAALAGMERDISVIDPMCGTGDMLLAAASLSTPHSLFAGIEIDQTILHDARRRLQEFNVNAKLISGNAFSLKTLKLLPQTDFDLVITNPPYVRYQALAHQAKNRVPNAEDVRGHLLAAVDVFNHLPVAERDLLRDLIGRYSGHSDLAVPAWLLCAMLTRVNGRLAMVLPEGWLTRNYASVVQYMLQRWFKIEFIVEDAHARWFSSAALVKTTLLVARRIDPTETDRKDVEGGFLHVRLFEGASTSETLVGRFGFVDPERDFADRLRALLQQKEGWQERDKIRVDWTTFAQHAGDVNHAIRTSPFLSALNGEDPATSEFASESLPGGLGQVLPDLPKRSLNPLAAFDVHVGQGLRTGANRFFYVDLVAELDGFVVVQPDPIFELGPIPVPVDCVAPVLRKQSEIPTDRDVDSKQLSGRVLVLRNYALKEDLERVPKGRVAGLRVMPDPLAELVRRAARTNLGTAEAPKLIPSLSSVRTNVRNSDGFRSHFWYHLPAFACRHSPDILVARINHQKIRFRLNGATRPLVDANFSTLWRGDKSRLDSYSLLALLNSEWCVLICELRAPILGGGALKLEATHIRRVLFPQLSLNDIRNLRLLGRELHRSPSPEIQEKIDDLVFRIAVGRALSSRERAAVSATLSERLAVRSMVGKRSAGR